MRKLARDGVELEVKTVDGQSVAQRATLMAADGMEVFKRYDEIKADVTQAATRNSSFAKRVSIGKTDQGSDIVGIKSQPARAPARDGAKPSTLFIGAQHAREWITPEMNRRLMHYLLDAYTRDRRDPPTCSTRNELWIIPVANPDGYDYTFTEGQRLWRKNLRDNDGDGQITGADGVDLNRNFAYKWGYDNEGSSPDPTSETYRGPSRDSEPETQALDRSCDRVGPSSSSTTTRPRSSCCTGSGWQVATPTPDDIIGEAMAGDDEHPAVPGLRPRHLRRALHDQRRHRHHLHENYGAFGFTPEMAHLRGGVGLRARRRVGGRGLRQRLRVPGRRGAGRGRVPKNLPFALVVAESASDPDDPVSVGRARPRRTSGPTRSASPTATRRPSP